MSTLIFKVLLSPCLHRTLTPVTWHRVVRPKFVDVSKKPSALIFWTEEQEVTIVQPWISCLKKLTSTTDPVILLLHIPPTKHLKMTNLDEWYERPPPLIFQKACWASTSSLKVCDSHSSVCFLFITPHRTPIPFPWSSPPQPNYAQQPTHIPFHATCILNLQ